jgi:hypothetical protein
MPNADVPIGLNRVPRMTMVDGISVRSDVLFMSDKGEEKELIQKRATKMLRKLHAPLQKILLPGETVLGIMSARSPLSRLEQITAGALISALTLCVVVVTNKRILFFPVKRDQTWRESARAVSWGDVQEVRTGGFLVYSAAFIFKNGSKAVYTRIRRADAKKLAAIALALIPVASGEQTAAHCMVQLCPDCCSVLTPGRYSCSSCGLMFKDEKTMIWRSILLPAGGYFYTGHPVVAIFPAIVEGILLVDVVNLLYRGLMFHQADPTLPGRLLALAIVWVFETAVTILHCRRYIREFIPEKRDPARVPQAARVAKG